MARAVRFDKYGDREVLYIADVEVPLPPPGEVVVEVRAAGINIGEVAIRAGALAERFPTPFPSGEGSDLAGVIHSIGEGVVEFAVGDEVFGLRSGAHAEYVCIRERGALAHKPAAMTFEEASAVCDGASIALACVRNADLRTGRSILVYGASGSIGTAAVQLARYYDAHVTAVCNTKNVELVRSLGADEVIDYLHEDFTKNGETYDVIFDAVGKHSFRRCRRSLKPGGTFFETDLGFMWHVPLLALLTRLIGDKKVTLPMPRYTRDEVLFLKELIEAGKYRAVIDRSYPLEQVVEATRYVETGQKTGNVVLTVVGGGTR